MKARVGILILNYNRCEDTIECLGSVRKCTYENKTILVVDNASTDSSPNVLKEMLGKDEFAQSTTNLGFAAGNNFGFDLLRKRNPKYVLLLNNDTLVKPDFLDHMVEALEADANLAAAGATVLYYPDSENVWYGGGRFRFWRATSISLLAERTRKMIPNRLDHKTTFITGCAMLLRVEAVKNESLFDERFFMYFEDAELSLRLLQSGNGLVYVPQAIVYHKVAHHGDTPFTMYYGVRNRFLLINSVTSGISRIIALFYLFASFGMKISLWAIVNRPLARSALWGWSDYVRGRFGPGRGVTLAKRVN